MKDFRLLAIILPLIIYVFLLIVYHQRVSGKLVLK